MKIPRFTITGSSVINVVGSFIVLYLLVVLGETIKHNYDLGRQATALQDQMSLLQAQKDALDYNIQFYRTESFRDREARSKLGLQLPDENVIIIPRATPATAPQPAAPSKPAKPRSNFQQWADFLTGRSS